MKKNIYFFILSIFISCNDYVSEELIEENSAELKSIENVLEVMSEEVIVTNEYMKFKDFNTFAEIVFSDIPEEVKQKISSTHFKSLSGKYSSIETSHEYVKDSKINDFEEDIIPNRIRSISLCNYLNEDGIVLIGDTIYKFEGDYAYIITDGDFNVLKNIDNAKNRKSLKNVKYMRVIEPLTIIDERIVTKGNSGGQYDRSFVFNPTNTTFRREHVKFDAFILKNDWQAHLIVEMEGRAQKGEKILGKMIWWKTFSDEMIWAEIHINNGQWNYNPPPAGGYPYPSGINYLPKGLVAASSNQKLCRFKYNLGNSGGVSGLKANVTFKFKKSNYQPSNFQSVYTNNYTSIN